MSDNLKFWITLSVGFIGACAWAPFIYEKFQINHFDGKVISVYNNFNKALNNYNTKYYLIRHNYF